MDNQRHTRFLVHPQANQINFHAISFRGKFVTQELSAIEVTTTFCKRAAIAQQLTSCFTETMLSDALVRAEELDADIKTTRRLVGPLHGIPISLKETVNIKGVPTALGFASILDHEPVTQNSVLVDILLEGGAVMYVKTNVPQTTMTDSYNNIFGRVQNPPETPQRPAAAAEAKELWRPCVDPS